MAMVRSVFFYNSIPELQQESGLHFFEPRYRLLVRRALTEEVRRRHYHGQRERQSFLDFSSPARAQR